jgi:hypothetical protein
MDDGAHGPGQPDFSQRLAERIQATVSYQKSFIVSAVYTGPDRRCDQSWVSTILCFYPPNSLVEKEQGHFVDNADLKWCIDLPAREICAKKFQRVVFN